ncbi:unnamed protein product [Effrenium voratum]|nr:unnamed protein product [Effrenium voratum]
MTNPFGRRSCCGRTLGTKRRLSFSVKCAADLLHLVRGGDGSGLLVDEALCASYPGAVEDIKQLISSKAVRSVRPQRDEKPRRKAEAIAEVADTFPLGEVLFSRFEADVEALKVDDDIREAFHATGRPAQGDVAARIAPKAEPAPTKRQRRAPQKPRKVQNVHMAT